ncbi:acyl-CoA reductase [Aquimarina hainanensis]|uniref:Acyl-CoA reductase n=1 Tax=Aquimarina hainanensis TaxID=1578017 RepID=A0ABW5NEW7_9FLAO
MILSERIAAFSKLSKFLNQFTHPDYTRDESVLLNHNFFDKMTELIHAASHHNGWFTPDNVIFSLSQWSKALQKEQLTNWISAYKLEEKPPKKIGLILAGNIPLVGFHDFLSVLISGNDAIIKLSSDDTKLLPFLASYLIAVEPRFKEKISFTEEKLQSFDAIIATGSNNTARYFEHYFNKVPNIIRKNRNSVAILTGKETPEQLNALGEDIFRYFGLGCRSVSKLFVPEGYDFDTFFKATFQYNDIINGAKYANNYDYNKAVYLMSNYTLLENGFLMLKEDSSYSSPIATLFYEKYKSLEELDKKLTADQDKIQCIVSAYLDKKHIAFGQTQSPQLDDYADGVDVIEFLIKIQ